MNVEMDDGVTWNDPQDGSDCCGRWMMATSRFLLHNHLPAVSVRDDAKCPAESHPLHPSGMPAFRLIYGRQWSMSPIASINTKHQANVADIASKIVNRCSYFAKISTTRSAHSFIGQYPSLCQHKCKLVFYLVANVRTHQRLHTWIKVSV